MQLQPELLRPVSQVREKPICLFRVLKSHRNVIRVPHDDYVAVRHLLPPCVHSITPAFSHFRIRRTSRSSPIRAVRTSLHVIMSDFVEK
jgi:hypothetical protein